MMNISCKFGKCTLHALWYTGAAKVPKNLNETAVAAILFLKTRPKKFGGKLLYHWLQRGNEKSSTHCGGGVPPQKPWYPLDASGAGGYKKCHYLLLFAFYCKTTAIMSNNSELPHILLFSQSESRTHLCYVRIPVLQYGKYLVLMFY